MRDFFQVLATLLVWAVFMVVFGVVLRINWELFMLGWGAL